MGPGKEPHGTDMDLTGFKDGGFKEMPEIRDICSVTMEEVVSDLMRQKMRHGFYLAAKASADTSEVVHIRRISPWSVLVETADKSKLLTGVDANERGTLERHIETLLGDIKMAVCLIPQGEAPRRRGRPRKKEGEGKR